MVKAFHAMAGREAGAPITIPPETTLTVESILHGRELFDKIQCWKCHGPEGRGDGPSALTLTDTKEIDSAVTISRRASGSVAAASNQESLPYFYDGA